MKEKIRETLDGLKDFQRKTVDYVFEQLYINGRTKMLIADEVGLGKTIVAKGIIAKAFEKFVPKRNKPSFNVVYICSNQALAKQNLKKLNFTGNSLAIDYSNEDDRVTSLAYVSMKEERKITFKIKAFTPATSFDRKTHPGRASERILLYRLLYRYSDISKNMNCLKWILKDNKKMKDENWEKLIRDITAFDKGKDINWVRKIRPKVYSKFRKELDKVVGPDKLPWSFKAAKLSYPVKYWTLIKNLCSSRIRKNNYYNYPFTRELIGSLRFLLSKVCLEYLQADIFILDEFQRYKQLIDSTAANIDDDKPISPAIELARDIFSFNDSKILMLSATPFKPYTNDFNELQGEEHFKEFNTVLQFLMPDKTEEFWKVYEKDRRSFFRFLCHPELLDEKKNEAVLLKEKLENLYRTCIVRTEKLLASKEKDTLIKHVSNKPINIQKEDIDEFVTLDRLTQLLNKNHKTSLPVPMEYVKSSPFSLSYLDNYQHKEKIKKFVLKDEGLQQALKKTKRCWLNIENMNQYKPLIPSRGKALPNAKLRLLLDETVLNNGWKYLWIPPSIAYYELTGAFKESDNYSKTIIFSSWKMVPRMIASLVSYEAERLSIGNPKSISEKEKVDKKRTYFQKPRSPKPQFTFKVEKEEQEPTQMNNFMLSYPSCFLADLYDPAINIIEKKELSQIKIELKNKLIEEFNKNCLNQYVSGEGDWKKWYWLAPLMFDKAGGNASVIIEWFMKGIPPSELSIDIENVDVDKRESTGKSKHFDHAKSLFLEKNLINVGKLDQNQLEKVCEHLAVLTLGSPAICYIRNQIRDKELSIDLLDASFNVASAFMAMFNKPESIAVVRLHTDGNDYWHRTLQYMIDGNIQAMMDEFIYLLINCENLNLTSELSDYISEILSVRTTTLEIDDLKIFMKNLTRDKKIHKAIRSHYAVDFGKQKVYTAQNAGRQINIRQAFNSPFRPFVLASTSIGQEGLDFHLYCKKIFHWNLPSNPIDFEQREGRIHRYKGLVIRQNLAEKYKSEIKFENGFNNTWKEVFKIATKEKGQSQLPCELVPFWHTEPKNNIKIERFVPLYPFSRDIEKFDNLIRILTFYRLTFGQPRQEELINALGKNDISDNFNDLLINLSPLIFYNNKK